MAVSRTHVCRQAVGVAALLLIGAGLWATIVTPAAARDSVTLPFSCSLVDGVLRVQAAAERSYSIVGNRDRQVHRSCDASGRSCRRLVLHRFDLECGAHRVTWLDFVAAASRRWPDRIWVAHNRMHIRRGPLDRQSAAAACDGTFGLCWREPLASGETLVFPPGFAPAFHLRPRFVSGAPHRSPQQEPSQRVELLPTSPFNLVRSADGDESGAETGFWDTVIMPAGSQRLSSIFGVPAYPALLLLLLAMLATMTLGLRRHFGGGLMWQLRMRTADAAAAVGPVPSRSGEPEGGIRLSSGEPAAAPLVAATTIVEPPSWDEIVELAGTAQALSALVHHIVENMLAEGSMRDLLSADLADIDVLLTSPRLALAMETRNADEARRLLEVAIAGLQRIRTLARIEHERAPPIAAPAPVAPRTPDEAYAFLGVNPNADERVAKKVVDALRQNWHPDLATDAADRSTRETRIKQINAAWDLVRPNSARAA